MIDEDLSVILIDPRPRGGLRAILEQVAAYYGLTPERMLSAARSHDVAHPRQAFMWAARQVKWDDGRFRYSLPQIGRFLGVDHTTVLHGARRHEARLRGEFGPQDNSSIVGLDPFNEFGTAASCVS